ncbi:helix-turn-helix transcriptional regulator [Burkholderia sp. SRS-25]|uniref:helix-turn-helix domain-containing protein n=1 Tax=Burkholderia sp. SRS-25 TaxID=2094190 RepID=UPI001053FB0A|nr:helix-turn-helix transcriptional regulator [Burkholderia sp. SRS-25]TCW64252.1 XRE family transcriptional regulator [Burkholderia sp. SRS-25]
MDKFYEEFGRALRERRIKANLTQDDVASKVGLGRTSVTNIEKGRQQVSLHMLYQLADAVDAEPSSLLPPRSESKEKSELPAELESSLAKLGDETERQWAREFLDSPEVLASLEEKR